MKIIIYIIIILSFSFSSTISFSIDMDDSIFPNEDYSTVVINGSWNDWQGWGVALNDDDQDGIWQGSADIDNGTYEYVIAVTGIADNWSGWGSVINAPLGSMCDANPGDQWGNYGFGINNNDIEQIYCAGTCTHECTGNNGDNQLLRPKNYSNLTTVYIPFEWKQQSNANSYNLQVSLDNSFNEIILDTLVEDIIYLDRSSFSWDTAYWWRIKSFDSNNNGSDWVGLSNFQILSKKFPEHTADIYNQNLIQDGYVFFGGFGGTEATDLASGILDVNGNEIWNDGSFSFIVNHINEHGNIYGLSNASWPRNTGVKINFDRDILWSNPDDLNGDGIIDFNDSVDIHEIKQIHNGNYMAFVPDYTQLGPIPSGDWSFLFQSLGYLVDGETNEFPYIGMQIVEWDEDGNEIWKWNPFEHFTMQDTDLYGGNWFQAFDSGSFDWMHSNAFHFDDNESVIYVSHRHLSRISKIAYPSGEVIWNMGMPSEYNTGDDNICTDLGFSFQHNVQLLDDGTLIFFDNGNLSRMLMDDEYPTTRIRNVRVIEDSYCETIWEYELPHNLFGAGMGSVQLLENGNYLIYTFGNGLNQQEPTIIEITPDYEVLWNYQGIPNASWYRSYKIPSMYPDLFSVMVDNYVSNNSVDAVEVSDYLKFTINNNSGYQNSYNYNFSDNSVLFEDEQSMITIDPFQSADLVFYPINTNQTSSIADLLVFPENHDYALKEYMFNIIINDILIGDLNQDSLINVVDVIMLVNVVLSGDLSSSNSDVNNDNSTNVIDIVFLVSIILGN